MKDKEFTFWLDIAMHLLSQLPALLTKMEMSLS